MAPTFLIGSCIYAGLGILGYASAPAWAGKQTGLAKLLVLMTAFCMWLSWATVYMSQMNPLLVPVRNLASE